MLSQNVKAITPVKWCVFFGCGVSILWRLMIFIVHIATICLCAILPLTTLKFSLYTKSLAALSSRLKLSFLHHSSLYIFVSSLLSRVEVNGDYLERYSSFLKSSTLSFFVPGFEKKSSCSSSVKEISGMMSSI